MKKVKCLKVYTTNEELVARIQQAAARAGLSTSEWMLNAVEGRLDDLHPRPPKKAPPPPPKRSRDDGQTQKLIALASGFSIATAIASAMND